MALRVTTWNVNGIRNPFKYPPWCDNRTFQSMFDTLEADIIVLQETKIQRKDLDDGMVLVPGFDCYWSLPQHKKGYSGVVIYTRNAKCAPIRAEEGITGFLKPPNSTTCFRDSPQEGQIGGYPTREQLSQSQIDPTELDSEGRCVILEFPAFVIIGTYCPAQRDETRTEFRSSFLDLVDARIRNLTKMGKRVIWTGDLNISREFKDSAGWDKMLKEEGLNKEQYMSLPARRMFNQMLVGGEVYGPRDEGREDAVMWDITRAFHPHRLGMYTCWETKVNARPGNYGARIDYVVCSHDMKDWFESSDIQKDFHGSDHCPVYAVLKEKFVLDGIEKHVLDIMNPPGMFEDGVRKQEWTAKNHLPMSGKLIPEFNNRRSIKDMFARKPSLQKAPSFTEASSQQDLMASFGSSSSAADIPTLQPSMSPPKPSQSPPKRLTRKRSAPSKKPAPAKKVKIVHVSNGVESEVEPTDTVGTAPVKASMPVDPLSPAPGLSTRPLTQNSSNNHQPSTPSKPTFVLASSLPASQGENEPPSPAMTERSVKSEATTATPKQTWAQLFAKPIPPKCEHQEACKTMKTKKPGENCGRSFWMCKRDLGPKGVQEKGTQWRCATFVWCSDWDTRKGTFTVPVVAGPLGLD